MIRRITSADFRTIFFYVGRVMIGVALTMLIPIIVALSYGEFCTVVDFVIAMSGCLVFGFACTKLLQTDKSPNLFQAMLVASISWLIACAFSAVPYYLSGHMGSFLDAYFDVMSAFTTTGLVLIKDLDHVSMGLNMWRHMLTYMGGQGIVVMALTFLIRSTGGAYKIMVGEGKDEVLEPSIRRTSQNIWVISIASLIVGTLAIAIAGWYDGMRVDYSLFHGSWMFMSAWSTGGFAPGSQNVLFYHSYTMEFITGVFLVMGSFNFALHYTVWRGQFGELKKNIEIISFTITLSICMALVAWGLSASGVFTGLNAIFRRGLFMVISAHTTTGLMSVYALQMVHSWSSLAYMGICIAMMIGGSAASTAGGFKNIRMGIVFKGIIYEIKKLIVPETAITSVSYHHIKEQQLDTGLVRQAALIIVSYCFIYALGTVIGVMCGYPIGQSAFESISASSNSGLTIGVTAPTMPAILKITYIAQMYMGRLEFMAIYVLIGTIGLMAVSAFKRAK